MDLDMIWQLIDPKLLIVVVVCWIIGLALKQTPRVPDWSIIYIVTLTSVLLTIWLTDFGPESIIQGILAGAFAVYGNQLVKQAVKKEEQNNSLD